MGAKQSRGSEQDGDNPSGSGQSQSAVSTSNDEMPDRPAAGSDLNPSATESLEGDTGGSTKSVAQVPPELRCCITQSIMTDPVLAMDGHVYERKAIEQWLKRSERSPLTNEPLESKTLVPCHPIKAMISAYHQKHGTQPDAASSAGSRRSSNSSQAPAQSPSLPAHPQRLQRTESLSRRAMLSNAGRPPAQGARNPALGSGMNRNFGGSSRHLVVPAFDEREPLPEVPREDDLLATIDGDSNAAVPVRDEGRSEGSALRMELSAELAYVGASTPRDLACMVTLKAEGPGMRDQRPGLDVVAVVDSSGSMHGEKMRLLTQTLKFLASHLRPSDRLSIVAFNHRPSCVTPLRRMDAAGRAAIELAVDSSPKLYAGGGTDLAGGVLLGCKVLRQRATPNAISSVLVLTDGQDEDALALCRAGPSAIGHHLPAGCAIHAFGYGADHDANILCQLAEAEAGGTFTFVEEYEGLESAFGCCLGGLLSVVAHRIRLKVGTRGWTPPGAEGGGESERVVFDRCISQVNSRRGYRAGAPGEWDGVEIDVGDMCSPIPRREAMLLRQHLYQGEQKDVLVSVKLPAWAEGDGASGGSEVRHPILEAECNYFVLAEEEGSSFANAPRTAGPSTLTLCRQRAAAEETLPHGREGVGVEGAEGSGAGGESPGEGGRSLSVDEQRNRVLASEALAAAVSLTSDRRKEQGMASLDAAIAAIRESWSAHLRLSEQLVEELEEAKRRLGGGPGASVHGTPAAGGEAYVRSLSMMHRHQRSASFRLSPYTTQEQGRLMGSAQRETVPEGGPAAE